MEGRGVEKDTERGIAILKKAAEGKSPVAQFRMAVHHLSGDKPDLASGYAYLVAAATGNLVEAQNELGLFYLSGKLGGADARLVSHGSPTPPKNGNAAAQNNLATLYEGGAAGLTRNLENAGQLYTLAANQGHGPATLALARLLSQGGDVKPDLVKAWALATLAFERGEKDAEKLATEIASKLDEKQLEEARKELADIKSGKPAESKVQARRHKDIGYRGHQDQGHQGRKRQVTPAPVFAHSPRCERPHHRRSDPEAIDPVRFLSNRSSGKMGCALADGVGGRTLRAAGVRSHGDGVPGRGRLAAGGNRRRRCIDVVTAHPDRMDSRGLRRGRRRLPPAARRRGKIKKSADTSRSSW